MTAKRSNLSCWVEPKTLRKLKLCSTIMDVQMQELVNEAISSFILALPAAVNSEALSMALKAVDEINQGDEPNNEE